MNTDNRVPHVGDIAVLNTPYLGYRRIELIEFYSGRWYVKICESGKEISVNESEFSLV